MLLGSKEQELGRSHSDGEARACTGEERWEVAWRDRGHRISLSEAGAELGVPARHQG